MSDKERSKRRPAPVPNKKQTATMKRRALKPKAAKSSTRAFTARVQVEQNAP
jgi:hypothetical protein